jgi:biopolymer transport protein ExbD
MALRRRNRGEKHPAVELNITAFMNLMVVLVPFLLMTAVFSHLTILELNLPAADSGSADKPKEPPYELRITIRKNALNLSDNRVGLIKSIPVTDKGQNYAQLTETLKQIKARLQENELLKDKSNATILLEPDTPYDSLVQVMDSSRMYQVWQDGELINAELFPDLSIGDAPAIGTAPKL